MKYHVNINGVTREVTLLSHARGRLSFELEAKRYDVAIECGSVTDYAQAAAPQPTPVSPTPRVLPTRESQKTAPGTNGDSSVRAPMPGILVSLAVRAGEQVRRGQTVAVIEAMKMENNISSHQDGVIEKILCETGKEVEFNQPLITLKPTAA